MTAPRTRSQDEHLVAALREIVEDRNIRRYLALTHPESLVHAQRALDEWALSHRLLQHQR